MIAKNHRHRPAQRRPIRQTVGIVQTICAGLLMLSCAGTLRADNGVTHLFNIGEASAQLDDFNHGEVVTQRWHGNGLNIELYQLGNGAELPSLEQSDSRYEVVLICLRGTMTMNVNEKTYQVADSELMIIPPGFAAGGKCTKGPCLVTARFSPAPESDAGRDEKRPVDPGG